MGTWMTLGPTSGKALLRQFAILGFVAIGVITLVLSVMLSSLLRRDLLDREWVITADYVRSQILSHLTPSVLAAPDSTEAQDRFDRFFQQVVRMPEVFRIKIYAADGTVVWSDEAHQIGRRFPDNPHLIGALAGQTLVNMESGAGKTENVGERSVFAHVVEVYVPIVFPQASRVAGVVELYKMPQQVFESIRRGQMTTVGAVLVCGALLYGSLFWIVRRAAARIDEQHRALERRSQDVAVANQELRAVQGQLLEAERLAAIGEVVTAVAHGIRNPLANIRAAAQVARLGVQGANPAAPTAKHLAGIMTEVDRLERRLRELLQFVRPAERQDAAVDLNRVVTDAAHMMTGRVAAAGVALTQALSPDLPRVSGNAMLLEQVVLSLLSNAVEAVANGGGSVAVETGMVSGSAASAVFVEVRDNGAGIPSEHLPSLFKPFFTTKAQGTGLGLAVAKKYTEHHGGTIAVSGRPGEGATFRVTLPACTET